MEEALRQPDGAGERRLVQEGSGASRTSGQSIVSLGEGNSPLIRSEALAREFGVAEVRDQAMRHVAHRILQGSGNDRSGLDGEPDPLEGPRRRLRFDRGYVGRSVGLLRRGRVCRRSSFFPKTRSRIAQLIQPIANGAITLSIDTDFDGCMKIVQEITRDGSIYLANSMNSLRVEGQKTISFEIAQQLGWEVPDFVVVPGGNLGNISAIANGFVLMKQMGLVDRIPRLVCAQTEKANPFYRSYVHGFETMEAMTAGDTLATAIQIGNPVSFPKAVGAMKATNGIVEQVTEAELANAASRADRFGFFNDPQTGRRSGGDGEAGAIRRHSEDRPE